MSIAIEGAYTVETDMFPVISAEGLNFQSPNVSNMATTVCNTKHIEPFGLQATVFQNSVVANSGNTSNSIFPMAVPLSFPIQDSKFVTTTLNQSDSSAITRIDACVNQGSEGLTLSNGKLYDNMARVGYIGADHKLTLDTSYPTDALVTDKFYYCSSFFTSDGQTVFFQCPINGAMEIFDEMVNDNCLPIWLFIVNLGTCNN